jgi:protein-L-isoaspartate(D-aspartate) O-methyltransferase
MVGLDAERGINNGQPLQRAAWRRASLGSATHVLHVGAGTGYYSAILAQLVGEHGRVIAYEIEADPGATRRRQPGMWPQASVRAISGALSPLPACDVIYVNAGATHPLAAWLDALRNGARLIFPLTPDDGSGCMLLVTHLAAARYAARAMMRVSFIACVGARDPAASVALRRAFALGSVDAVRSLHRDDHPDESTWCAGPGWWLSTPRQRADRARLHPPS